MHGVHSVYKLPDAVRLATLPLCNGQCAQNALAEAVAGSLFTHWHFRMLT